MAVCDAGVDGREGRGPEVGLADEPGDEHRGRAVVDLGGRADLLDAAGVHDRDPVAHRERLFLVVGHVDEGDPDLALDALQLELHDLAQLEVEGAERLVEQQRLRLVDEGPGQRHALLLAARELRRLAPGEVLEPDDGDALVDLAGELGLVPLLGAGPEGHVVPHRHVGEQRVVLEDGVDVALVGRGPRHVLAVEADGAAGGRLEAGDHAQRRRLAAAGRTEHGEELAVGDAEVGVVDRGEVGELLGDVVDLDDRLASMGATSWRRRRCPVRRSRSRPRWGVSTSERRAGRPDRPRTGRPVTWVTSRLSVRTLACARMICKGIASQFSQSQRNPLLLGVTRPNICARVPGEQLMWR